MPRREPPSEPLPALLDCATISRELGVTRYVADAIMRQLPTVTFPGVRKLYAKRADLQRLVEEGTLPPVSAAARRRGAP